MSSEEDDRSDQSRRVAEAAAKVVDPELMDALRQAAAHAWNTGEVKFDQQIASAIQAIAKELGVTRDEAVRLMVREWLEGNAYSPVRRQGEDDDTAGKT
ncbi:ribbon-helix-helix protein, CopG family [Rhizobium sp. YS-1r]|uniref:ribbon-helix-helix protein, CopG family n=1 Tax=Rhizobium sp. YS-1r TaxID=1532558 RepID=UPI00056BF068|nr:ribbon-helix-helix protein, CopG family [Rhizobium sp. YS-1r]